MSNTSVLVFCYGSLKRGFHNHHLLNQSKYLGDHVTEAEFTMYDLGSYPAITENGHSAIHGEVYDDAPNTFNNLDVLEGYPEFYNRIQIMTSFGFVWVYVLNLLVNGGKPVVKSGVWLKR